MYPIEVIILSVKARGLRNCCDIIRLIKKTSSRGIMP
jgi:hypothetical protein